MAREDDVTMDAIKYLESRLPPGIEGDTLVDGGTLAIAIGEFDAAQKRAAALASANARLGDALAALVDAEAHGTPGGYIGVDPSGETHDRHCTYCYTSWQLGEPERHDTDCPIASARRVLDGSA